MSYKTLKPKIDQFLNCHAIAVLGVSKDANQPANANYRKLKEAGYAVFPVNPNCSRVEGDACYPHVGDIPEKVDAALVFTHPDVTASVVEECDKAGISNIWIHKGMGGSTSKIATLYIKSRPGINFIDGACPLMFLKNGDGFHRGFRNVLRWTGGLPD